MTPEQEYHLRQGYRSLMRAIPAGLHDKLTSYDSGIPYSLRVAADSARRAVQDASIPKQSSLEHKVKQLGYVSEQRVGRMQFGNRVKVPRRVARSLSEMSTSTVYEGVPVQDTLALYVDNRKLPLRVLGMDNPIVGYHPSRSSVWQARGLKLYYAYTPKKVTGGWKLKVVYVVQELNSLIIGASLKSASEAATACQENCIAAIKTEVEKTDD